MLADMRTGSNFLEANLNAMEGVTCHGEAFNPNFIGKKDRLDYLGITLDARDRDPQALIAAMESEGGLSGFRFFGDHDPRVFDLVMADRRCAKIVLTRNPLESYVSLKIAQATGQWKLGDARRRREAVARFVPEEFEAHLARHQAFQLQILRGLQVSGQTAFWIAYEDIGALDVINGLAAYLGAPSLAALDDSVKKQNPEPIETLVENADEMAEALSRFDRFNLSRTPNFEPRRGAVVPSYLAAKSAPLLYLPIKGGPEGQIRDWLSRLGEDAGLLEGFTQKTLRQWQRSHPNSRSFTVLRHPLLRAHAAFNDKILSGEATETRTYLKRAWKLQLPPPEKLHKLSLEDESTAFLKFLGFLKGNLAGQTAVRIDASWASQSAVLQGFAAQIIPDLILREDDLQSDLDHLAAKLGVKSAPLGEGPPPLGRPLSDIMTPEHHAAVRDAYAKDFQAFGFSDWAG